MASAPKINVLNPPVGQKSLPKGKVEKDAYPGNQGEKENHNQQVIAWFAHDYFSPDTLGINGIPVNFFTRVVTINASEPCFFKVHSRVAQGNLTPGLSQFRT